MSGHLVQPHLREALEDTAGPCRQINRSKFPIRPLDKGANARDGFPDSIGGITLERGILLRHHYARPPDALGAKRKAVEVFTRISFSDASSLSDESREKAAARPGKKLIT